MKKFLKTLLLGILAGISISLGGTFFIIAKSLGLPTLGGFLFSIGLFLVCTFKFNLFTGKIGYLFDNKKNYSFDLLIMYIGNFIGAILMGYLIRILMPESLVSCATIVSTNKLSKDLTLLFSSGLFCGVFVYLAVDVFKNKKIPYMLRLIWLICCVASFVILGFDHCIANMFYFGFAKAYSNNIFSVIISLLIVTIGNSLGAIFVNFVKDSSKC